MPEENVPTAYFSIGASVAHFSQRQTFRPGDMTEMGADGIEKMTTPVVAG